jgi:hypothetical protein
MAMTSGREQAGPELARLRGFERCLITPVVDFGFLMAHRNLET